MQIAKWGNSLAVRLPAVVIKELGLKEGDNVEIISANRRHIKITKKPSAKELLANIQKFKGRVPLGFKFNRDEANEK